jgi:Putative mono-oxygenase ydhR
MTMSETRPESNREREGTAMKLLVVRYGRELGSDDPEQAGAFLAAAEKIAGLPGLIWKLWAYDDATHAAESVYLFDSGEHARAWGDGPMASALASHPGISDIEVRYYDVDEQLSAVTGAPLQSTAHAPAARAI